MTNYKKIKNIFIDYNDNDRSFQCFLILSERLLKNGYTIMENFSSNVDLVVTIGGDGTFLNVVNKLNYPDCFFVGVNTGHLGFFQEFSTGNIDELIDALNSDTFSFQEITPLKATVFYDNGIRKVYAINEFALRHSTLKALHLEIHVSNYLIENFSGDGVIVSSTVGSTGYNYSAGGAIIDPKVKLIQIAPVSPLNTNAFRSITSGIILPYDEIVTINIPQEYANNTQLMSDGNVIPSKQLKKVEISHSEDKNIKLIRYHDFMFWNKIREKFL